MCEFLHEIIHLYGLLRPLVSESVGWYHSWDGKLPPDKITAPLLLSLPSLYVACLDAGPNKSGPH